VLFRSQGSVRTLSSLRVGPVSRATTRDLRSPSLVRQRKGAEVSAPPLAAPPAPATQAGRRRVGPPNALRAGGGARPAARRRGPQDGIRPEIQALRATAVLLVVVYHLWPRLLSGGYVGVDVFFAISGFLITTQL